MAGEEIGKNKGAGEWEYKRLQGTVEDQGGEKWGKRIKIKLESGFI